MYPHKSEKSQTSSGTLKWKLHLNATTKSHNSWNHTLIITQHIATEADYTS
jgi:hypothetical protein